VESAAKGDAPPECIVSSRRYLNVEHEELVLRQNTNTPPYEHLFPHFQSRAPVFVNWLVMISLP
jgi:hypothetical protein